MIFKPVWLMTGAAIGPESFDALPSPWLGRTVGGPPVVISVQRNLVPSGTLTSAPFAS